MTDDDIGLSQSRPAQHIWKEAAVRHPLAPKSIRSGRCSTRRGEAASTRSRSTDQGDDVAHPFQLTAFGPGVTVYVVERTAGNEHTHALERTPDVRVSSATVPRPPEELGEILATVVTDESGQATIPALPARGPNSRRFSGHGLPQKRYWALGLIEGEWQRVSFSMKGP